MGNGRQVFIFAFALFSATSAFGSSGYESILTLSTTGYCVGDSWELSVAPGPSLLGDVDFRLIGGAASNGGAWEVPHWGKSNRDVIGVFASNAVGRHTLYLLVNAGEYGVSNTVSFSVADCGRWGDTAPLNTASTFEP